MYMYIVYTGMGIYTYLLCHLVLYISLDSPKHEWFEDHVQSRQLVLVQCTLLLCMALNVTREPLIELFMGVKHSGHDEVKQSPQLQLRNSEKQCTCVYMPEAK